MVATKCFSRNEDSYGEEQQMAEVLQLPQQIQYAVECMYSVAVSSKDMYDKLGHMLSTQAMNLST